MAEVEVGDGVTVQTSGVRRPGTIIRVATHAKAFWYQLDAVVVLPERKAVSARDLCGERLLSRCSPSLFVRDPSAWVHRALRQPDGSYREDDDMWPVLPGSREFAVGPIPAPPGPVPRSLEDLELAVKLLEPYLLKTRWYPMTYMGMGGVVKKAEDLIAELQKACEGKRQQADRAEVLRARMEELRKGFKRVR